MRGGTISMLVPSAPPDRTFGLVARGHERTAVRVQREHPDVDALRIRRLDQLRLAGLGIHGQHCNRVLHVFGDDFLAPKDFLAPAAIRDVERPAIGGVHADRRCRLSRPRPCRRCAKASDEQGLGRKSIVHDAERMQLVLRLDDDVHPLAGRMKLDVTAAKLPPAVRRHRLPVRELAVGVAEYLEGADVPLLWTRDALIAARRHDDRAAGGHDADLMGIDSGRRAAPCANLGADRAVGVQPMNGDAARIVEGGQHMLARVVDRDVDRPMAQADRSRRPARALPTNRPRMRSDNGSVDSQPYAHRCSQRRNIGPIGTLPESLRGDDGFAELDERFAVACDPVAQQSGADVGIDIRSYSLAVAPRGSEAAQRRRARRACQPCS